MAEPPKAKITALVCSGRKRLNVSQLGSDDDAYEHADDAPDNSHDGELPDNLVVIGHGHGVCGHSGEIPRVLNAGIFSGRDLSLNK
jgi:hypothetical protein